MEAVRAKTKKKKSDRKISRTDEPSTSAEKNMTSDLNDDRDICTVHSNTTKCENLNERTLTTDTSAREPEVLCHVPAYIDNSTNCNEIGTELDEMQVGIHGVQPETSSTNFQNTFPFLDVSNEQGHCVKEDPFRPLDYLTLEEDEFALLTEKVLESNDINAFTETQLLSIYRNEELELVDKFVDSFIDVELRSGTTQQHPLYFLLMNYLRTREKQLNNSSEIDGLLRDCKDFQQRLWILETVKIIESGECQDGNPVEASHDYQIGRFDQGALNSLTAKLASVRDMVHEQHSLHTYSCQVAKLKVDNYIGKLCDKFSSLPHNLPVSLASDTITRTTDLCSAISVLFYFHRQPISDPEMRMDTRQWLTRLVALLLRVADWSQHMFLLNHLLRCPGSVVEWSVCFLQSPPAPFNCSNPGNYLNHMIATLATIMKPIRDRHHFVPELEKSTHESEEVWVMVDSEGEDDEDNGIPSTCLRENDIIAILNQVPLEHLFRQMLQITKRDDMDVYEAPSSSQILRVFAMSRLLIRILCDGMKTYGRNSHTQFSKRLASILTHTVLYVSDMWETFKRDSGESPDLCMVDRLQVEYDNIVICACFSLLVPQHKTVLQFLTALPFSSVTLKTLWRMFHMIMQPAKIETLCRNTQEWWTGVEELIPSLSEVELYYVLTAVANMALARSLDDWLFIKAVTNHLLQIGFINTSTRDSCYKISRTLLSNLTSKHPSLISVILEKLKICLSQAGNLSVYLFRELPLVYWVPNKNDLNLLEHWLLICPYGSVEGSLSRFILSNLHWGPSHDNSGELFLKREIHCEVALLVVRLAILYCPETTSSSNTIAITDTIKQMSLKVSLSRVQTEHSLSSWVWQMLYKLRLHLMDQPHPHVWATLANPMQYFSILPSLESLPNELSPLVRALKEKQITALYTSLLMTSTGHSIPLICNSGFSMLLALTQSHRYFAALVVLQHVVPLFLDCQGSLLLNEDFIKVIQDLVTADKTFLKYAKSLISADFPGIIVKQFGDLIQLHLDSYRKYNLSSPAPLAELWLHVLSKVWLLEPTNTSYLMDVILRSAFFRPDIKAVAVTVIHQLYDSVSSGSKSSLPFARWVTGSSQVISLIPKSAPDTPWFALFALQIEEYSLQTKTGLWRQLLVDLVTSVGKSNIDSTLKKSCSTLKLEPIPSGALSIYRWSQQALDTPVDHPVLPIFWQKFFTLYLARVPIPPGGKDLGCVGSKFFEGLTNFNYMKRLKKKILDCKEFYETKCANSAQVVTPERKDWLENMAKFYNTFLFWLEELSLQDPGVYLPALPPPYKPEKLSAVFHNDATPWHEYVDFDSVRCSQRECLDRWEQALSRKYEVSSRPSFTETETDPIARIIKRLQSYESPQPPPPLKPAPPVVTLPPIEAFYNKHLLLDVLNGPFKALLNFAQGYTMRATEHFSLDCCLLELAPLLYRTVDTSVTLHAACDTHSPQYKPSINSLNCAGPAIVHLKVPESRVSEATDMAIHNNRLEVTGLIKRALQPPPMAVSQASIQIEHSVEYLEDKYSDLRRIGDVQMLRGLEEVGVALFYHMTSLFTEEAALYPPLKQLITTCIESLGQTFVSEDERQCPLLLSTLLESPSLSSLLSTHFSPTKASSQVFVQLYRTLANSISSTNYDLIFVLLTKFDMMQWLELQKPRVSDRSVLISLIGKALASAGQTPEQNFIMIHEVLRRQLCVLLSCDPPAHHLEVIRLCLTYTEAHCLATEVWTDLINSLASPVCVFRPHLSLAESVHLMAKFAIQQTLFSHHELLEVSTLLHRHFTEERLQYGLYGLYPKYRNYISPFTTFLGLFSHALVVSTIKKYAHSSSSKVCEEVWTALSGLYAPWLSPYYTRSLAQPMAAWIQQLTDDRSILPPWIAADSGHAHKVAAIFTESIRFLIESFPESEILSYVWQYYVSTFAHPSVKEHILTVIHSNLLSLSWHRFKPSLLDLDYMLKVSDTYVPYCHTLLGSVFVDVDWPNWLEEISGEASPKVHASLLHLVIKLSNEPNVRQSSKILDLLTAACIFNWGVVDSSNYESAVNWFVMSYDPRVVLIQENPDEASDVDKAVLELLRHAGGFIPNPSTAASSPVPVSPRKRQIFVRGSVKLLISSYNRYKQALRSDLDTLSTTIEDFLTQINTVVPLNASSGGEGALYISEVLALLTGPLSKTVHSTFLSWLSKRGDCVVTKALLRTLTVSVQDTFILSSLLEATLTSIFNDKSGSDWSSVITQMQDFLPRQPSLTETFLNERALFSLYVYFYKRLPSQTDLDEEAAILKDLTECLNNLKVCPDMEAKLVPLFHLGLWLGSRQADHNPEVTSRLLKTLVGVTEMWADHRPGWGLLGAIGLRKQHHLPNRCRLLCRIFAALVLSQFPERKGELVIDQQPFIRTTAHAPGGITSNNVELGPDSATLRGMSQLECLSSDKSYTPLQGIIEEAVSTIKGANTSLHNAPTTFLSLARLLYQERFVADIPSHGENC